MTFKLSASDLKQLIEYFDLRTENPCRNCGASPSTGCGCKEHAAWLDKRKTAEATVRRLPEEVIALVEAYITTARTIDKLKPELEAMQRVVDRLSKELNDYLEEDALKDVELS
jgi:adenylosuccinate lyase